MHHPIIRLGYRHHIDATSTAPFDQKIFNATWSEFLIQRQSFSKGQELYTWEDIRRTFPKSDPALPFKVGFAIAGALNAQNHRIPGLADALGDCSIPFEYYHFHLIASDARDRSTHRVSITYYTGDLTLLHFFSDQLLLIQTPPQTLQLKLQPGLSIIQYKSITTPPSISPTPPHSTPPSPSDRCHD
jgi:hypothetical protein